jgi:hypothetical protein
VGFVEQTDGSEELTTSADVRQHALGILQLAKKFLAEDGDLDPTAFIITADDQLLRPIELHDEKSKIKSCQRIVDEAGEWPTLLILFFYPSRDPRVPHPCGARVGFDD